MQLNNGLEIMDPIMHILQNIKVVHFDQNKFDSLLSNYHNSELILVNVFIRCYTKSLILILHIRGTLRTQVSRRITDRLEYCNSKPLGILCRSCRFFSKRTTKYVIHFFMESCMSPENTLCGCFFEQREIRDWCMK